MSSTYLYIPDIVIVMPVETCLTHCSSVSPCSLLLYNKLCKFNLKLYTLQMDCFRMLIFWYLECHIVRICLGGPRGCAVKSAVSLSLDHLTTVFGVGSSPALDTCETGQVLLAGVSGVFSLVSPVSAPPTDWPVSYELK